MKLRFLLKRYSPEIEIAPMGEFTFPNATLTIRFFQWSKDGGLEYKPCVYANVSFGGDTTPEAAKLWGECLVIASQIATRQMPTYIDLEYKDEIIDAWLAVDAVCAANGLAQS